MKKTTNSLRVALALAALIVVPSLRGQQPDQPKYDYSSPEASFRSLQEAIRKEDAEGFMVHSWQIRRHFKPNGEDANFTLKKAVEEFQARLQKKSWEGANGGFVEGKLKLTDAKVVRSEAVPNEDLQEGVTINRLLVEWPDAGKRANLEFYKFEGSKEWWFATFERAKTFDAKKSDSH